MAVADREGRVSVDAGVLEHADSVGGAVGEVLAGRGGLPESVCHRLLGRHRPAFCPGSIKSCRPQRSTRLLNWGGIEPPPRRPEDDTGSLPEPFRRPKQARSTHWILAGR